MSPGKKPWEDSQILMKEYQVTIKDVKDGVHLIDLLTLDSVNVITDLVCQGILEYTATTENVQVTSENKDAMCGIVTMKDLPVLEMPQEATVVGVVADDLNCFYVYIKDENFEMKLKELMEVMGVVTPFPPYSPCAGEVVLAQFAEDQCWYRAEVTNQCDNQFQVTFIDFGNKASLCADKISKFTVQLMKYPAFGLPCRLHNCQPVGSGWDPAYIKDRLFRAKFVKNQNTKDRIHNVTLWDLMDNLDLCDTLVKLGICKSVQQDSVPDVSQIQSPVVTLKDLPELKLPTTETLVFGSHVDSISCFYLQMMDPQILESFGSSSVILAEVEKCPPYKPQIGEIVLAEYEDSGCADWYRGVVLHIDNGSYKVHFFDYGNTESVTEDRISKMDPSLLKFPAFAFKCRFDDVSQGKKEWNKAEVKDKKMMGKCIRNEKDSCIVELKDERGEDIKSSLIKNGYAIKEAETSIESGYAVSHHAPLVEAAKRYYINDIPEFTFTNDEMKFHVSEAPDIENIFFQCVEQEKLQNFSMIRDSISSLVPISPYKPVIGEVVLGKFQNEWFRGVVEEIEHEKFRVLFIDFGNFDLLAEDCIAPFDPGLLQFEPFAIRGKLNIELKVKKPWNPAFIGGQMFIAKLVDKSKDAFILDLKYNDGGGSLVDSLITAGFAEKKPLQEKKPDKAIQRYTLADLPRLDIPQKDEVDVLVTDAADLMLIWVQIQEKEIETKYHDLLRAMMLSKPEGHYTPCKGEIVLAKFTDNCWYRAKICSVTEVDFMLAFIDFGNFATVSKDKIAKFEPSLLKFPPFALRCQLNQISPGIKKWNPNLFLDEKCKMKIISYNSKIDCNIVELKKNGQKESMNDFLIKEGYGMLSAVPDIKIEETQEKLECMMEHLPPLKLPQKKLLHVMVTDVTDLKAFWIISVEPEMKLVMQQIMNKIKNNLKNLHSPYSPQKDEIILAQFKDEWFRAQVCNVKEGKYVVFFIDFGNCDVVSKDRMAKLDPDLMQFPPLAIKCQFIDATVGKQWNPHENILLNQCFYGEICSTKDSINQVELYNIGNKESVKVVLLQQGFILCKKVEQESRGADKKGSDIENGKGKSQKARRDRRLSDSDSGRNSRQQRISDKKIDEKSKGTNKKGSDTDRGQGQKGRRGGRSSDSDSGRNSRQRGIENQGAYKGPGERKGSGWRNDNRASGRLENRGGPHGGRFGDKRNGKGRPDPGADGDGRKYGGNNIEPDGSKEGHKMPLNEKHHHQSLIQKDKMQSQNVDISPTPSETSSGRSTPQIGKMKKDTLALRQMLGVAPPVPKVIMSVDVPTEKFPSREAEVVPCHVVSPEEIYVQIANPQLSEKFKKVRVKINEQCNAKASTYFPIVGEFVCAKYKADNEWYRAEVMSTSVEDKPMLRVRFTDFGNIENVPYASVQNLEHTEAEVPHQAIQCALVDVKMDCPIFKPEDLLIKRFRAKLTGTQGGKHFVELFDESGESLNMKYQKAQQMNSIPKKKLESREVEVTVTHVESPDKFYVVRDENNLVQFVQNLTTDCEINQAIYNPRKGEYVACLNHPTWMRAQVKSLSQDKITAFFVDIGNVKEVLLKDVRKLNEKYMEWPCQAIACGLGSVSGTVGGGEWSPEALEMFKSTVTLLGFTMKVLDTKNNIYYVDLIGQNGSVSEYLVAEGYARGENVRADQKQEVSEANSVTYQRGVSSREETSSSQEQLEKEAGLFVSSLPSPALPEVFMARVNEVVSPKEIYVQHADIESMFLSKIKLMISTFLIFKI